MADNTTGTTGYASSDLLFIRSNLTGGALVGVFYGAVLVYYIQCMEALWRSRKKLRNFTLLMLHSTTVFVLNTLYTASTLRVLELTFVDNDAFVGGPIAYLNDTFNIPINILALVVFLMGNWLLDALMLWRCHVVYTGAYANFVIIFPSLVLLGSFISGTILIVTTSRPNISLWSNAAISSALPYYVFSLSFNIIVTILIILRLLYRRAHIRDVLGRKHAKVYASLAMFIVESSAPYAIISLIYLVLFAVNNPAQQLFTGISGGTQIIANYLLILRVAKGNTWELQSSKATVFETDIDVAFRVIPGAMQDSSLQESFQSDNIELAGIKDVEKRRSVPVYPPKVQV